MQRTFNKIALAAALLLTLGVTTSFAANTTDNEATTSFRKEFKQAEVLSTDAGKDYTKITFRLNGAVLTAFYNENGELLAITHNILSTQLPINLLMQLKQQYPNQWITDLFELNSNGNTSYFITLENSDAKVTLRSNEGQWEAYTSISKD